MVHFHCQITTLSEDDLNETDGHFYLIGFADTEVLRKYNTIDSVGKAGEMHSTASDNQMSSELQLWRILQLFRLKGSYYYSIELEK